MDLLFQVLQKNPKSSLNQEKFFDEFPHSFKEFWETYGYKGKVDNPMYSLSDSHIDSFAKLDKTPAWKYYKRLIDLSISRKWDADAINRLQEILAIKAKEKTGLLFSLLSLYSKEEIYSFGFF